LNKTTLSEPCRKYNAWALERDRDFTAEAQRGRRSLRKKERRLNTKAPGHKGQREREETFSRKDAKIAKKGRERELSVE